MTYVWAHRGASGYAPENTLEAFALADKMKADGIELDVHLSKDGEIIVTHDENVQRVTCGVDAMVKDLTLAELKKLDVYNGIEGYRNVRIPTLPEVLDFLKTNNLYTKNESKITFNDIADCLALVINSFSTMTSYENQTKKAINNPFICDALNNFLRKQLEIYFIENPKDAEQIAKQVLVNKRSRESAEKARGDFKKKLAGSMDVSNRVEKFVNCRSKDPARAELYIVEGDSALTSCKLGRDAEFQAIIPVRGKTLNCLKCDYARIFKSDIIVDLLRVIGCGVEVKGKTKSDLNSFDLNNLRWSKIIICTDADVDGYQIRTLVLAMIYRLMPELIEAGKVYIAVSPLYEIIVGGKSYFAYNEKEKADILKKFEGKKVSVQRSKGLGENEPEMMSLTTMHPDTRRLQKIMPSDVKETAEVFDVLLGNDLQGRKEIIANCGREYIDLADIS